MANNLEAMRALKFSSPLSIAIALFALTPLILWMVLDHSVATWDGARHALIARAYAELIAHAHPLDPEWYQQLYQVNTHYPPFIHLCKVPMYLAGLNFPRPEHAITIAAALLLNLSTYAVSMAISRDRIAAILSVFLINAFPLTAFVSRSSALDFPAMTATAIGLWLLTRLPEKVDRQAPVWSILFLICVSVKVSVCLFLVAPLILTACLRHRVLSFPSLKKILCTTFLTLLAVGFVAPPALNYSWDFVASVTGYRPFSATTGEAPLLSALSSLQHQLSFQNLSHTIANLPALLSVQLIAVIAIAALFRFTTAARRTNTVLLPEENPLALIVSSSTVGLLLVSMVTVPPVPGRYLAPILVSIAILTAHSIAAMFEPGKRTAKILPVLASATILGSFLHIAHLSASPVVTAEQFTQATSEDDTTVGGCSQSISPVGEGDLFGHHWFWKTIDEAEKNSSRPKILCLMPNTTDFNGYTLKVVQPAGLRHVEVASVRNYSTFGDVVNSNHEWYQYALLKSGDQGHHLADVWNINTYEACLRNVKESGKFRKIGSKTRIDGSVLELYQRIQ